MSRRAPRGTEKFGLLRSILQLDAQIRHLANPWQHRLDTLLSPGKGSPGAQGGRPA